jgi:alkylation response protein AidB-like acyl-CoA dehydrogenase
MLDDRQDCALDAFRSEVRTFIRSNLPAEIADRGLHAFHPSRDDQVVWGKILDGKGWSAPAWPVEHGGCGWSSEQLQIFDEECYLAGAPELSLNGIRLVGPVIYTFGSEAIKRRFLPPTLSWDIFWGQGFSEPDAGSDLASLKTSAVRDGEDYIVNGSKIWTSDAQFAEWLFCLVRTDNSGRKQQGISFLLIEASSPGVEVRPIPSIDNQHTLNQIFFTDVRVPCSQLVGQEGDGWSYAKFLLGNERTASAMVPRLKFYMQRLLSLSVEAGSGDQSLENDPVFAHRLAVLEAELLALEQAVLVAMRNPGDSPEAFARASVLKLKGSHLLQNMGELMMDAIGADSSILCSPVERQERSVPSYVAGITSDFLFHRACTIYGGSAEVQRNIIASTLLRSAA